MVNYIEIPNEKELLAMRKKYKAGIRVCLTKMDDAYAPPIGTCGTVSYVDDIGSIFVNWDNGSTLALVYGVDKCEVVSNTKRVQGKKIPQKISRNTLFKSEA